MIMLQEYPAKFPVCSSGTSQELSSLPSALHWRTEQLLLSNPAHHLWCYWLSPSALFFSRMRNSHVRNPLATKTFKPASAFDSLLWAFKVPYCFPKTWTLHCWSCSCAVNYGIGKELTQKLESSQGPLSHPKARGEKPQHKPERSYQTVGEALGSQVGCDGAWRVNAWARWLLLLHLLPGPWDFGHHQVKAYDNSWSQSLHITISFDLSC